MPGTDLLPYYIYYVMFISVLVYKCFQGAVRKYFATVFPEGLQVALHTGRLLEALAVLCYLLL